MDDTTSLGETASTSDIASAVYAELSEGSPPSVETTAETTTPTPDAAPTAPPVAASQTESPAPATETPSVPGPVAYERFQAVNERMKAAEARAQSLAALEPWHQRFQTDQVAFAIQLVEELQAHPQYSPALRSQAARWLRAPQAAAPEAMPEADLVDAQGHGVYSADRMRDLLQWQQKQLLGQVEQTLAPITERQAQADKIAEAKAVMSGIEKEASTILTEWRKAPGWTTTSEPQIKARYAELVKQGVPPERALGFAYRDVVVPTLQQQERHAVTSALQTKTHATTISPQRSVTTPAKNAGVRETRDIAREVFAEMRAT